MWDTLQNSERLGYREFDTQTSWLCWFELAAPTLSHETNVEHPVTVTEISASSPDKPRSLLNREEKETRHQPKRRYLPGIHYTPFAHI